MKSNFHSYRLDSTGWCRNCPNEDLGRFRYATLFAPSIHPTLLALHETKASHMTE